MLSSRSAFGLILPVSSTWGCSRARLRAAGATQRRLDLHEGRLVREDRQGLLQAGDLLLAAALALGVGHHLRLALRLELVKVVQDRGHLVRERGMVLLVVRERQ